LHLNNSRADQLILYIACLSYPCTTINTPQGFSPYIASAHRAFDPLTTLRRPEQFARLWIHTHPGDSAQPSGVDEATFERVFGQCDWSVMFIMAQNSSTYTRISFNVGPRGQVLIPTEVDFSNTFPASDQNQWDREYETHVYPEPSMGFLDSDPNRDHCFWDEFNEDSVDLLDSMEDMDQIERQGFWDDLANRPELWGSESEVISL